MIEGFYSGFLELLTVTNHSNLAICLHRASINNEILGSLNCNQTFYLIKY